MRESMLYIDGIPVPYTMPLNLLCSISSDLFNIAGGRELSIEVTNAVNLGGTRNNTTLSRWFVFE